MLIIDNLTSRPHLKWKGKSRKNWGLFSDKRTIEIIVKNIEQLHQGSLARAKMGPLWVQHNVILQVGRTQMPPTTSWNKNQKRFQWRRQRPHCFLLTRSITNLCKVKVKVAVLVIAYLRHVVRTSSEALSFLSSFSFSFCSCHTCFPLR